MISVLFVCMGNICRSPALAATLEALAKKKGLSLHVDSCGMGAWFVGKDADPRMCEELAKRGIDVKHKARALENSDFEIFDYIFAVTKGMTEELQGLSPKSKNISLVTDFSEKYRGQDIPDPYFAEQGGLEHAVDMIEDSCKGILESLSSKT